MLLCLYFFLKFYSYKDRGTWAAWNICFAQHATNKHKHLEKIRQIASVQASLCLPIFVPSSLPCGVVCVLNVPGYRKEIVFELSERSTPLAISQGPSSHQM
jgi:hypothetical protein